MKKLGLLDVKQAILGDDRFRELFPNMKKDFDKVIRKPGCACNMDIYKQVLKSPDKLKEYFPNREIPSPEDAIKKSLSNYWTVTNCNVSELESHLNSLHKLGKKQVAIARYQDQLTIVINELD